MLSYYGKKTIKIVLHDCELYWRLALMTSYVAPVKDTLFILRDVLVLEKYGNLAGFGDVTDDLVEAVVTQAARLSQDVLHPLNHSGDTEGCHWQDGDVKTPSGFKQAYDAYCEGGWSGLPFAEQYGGQNLPVVIACSVDEYMTSANMSFSMYPGLTHGAISALLEHGSDAQKNLYIPKMISGEWTGTMNLTESHCGTDLGLIRTKAVRQDNDSFSISGQKIFISAGEHDLSENIIHLVLARIDGAPDGVKGISLFIVPKFIPDESGNIGKRNGVSCASIEKKMGIHGNSTCVLNYDEAQGFLVGEENRGLNAMFVMMNEARLRVGLQGLSQSEISYQNAVLYARERRQGRAVTGAKEPDQSADPLIVHADIRRQLMTMKCINESSRALILWAALQVDIHHRSTDEEARQTADDLMGLLTPVIKGMITERGFQQAVLSQQIYGGHGYIEEHGMAQFVRDARIAMIYEGTNGIQALDLVGRKLPRNGGRAFQSWMSLLNEYCTEQSSNESMKPFIEPLQRSMSDLQSATMWLLQNATPEPDGDKGPDNAAGVAHEYMHLFGLVALGYMWAQMAQSSLAKESKDEFYATKLVSARHFMTHILPETSFRLSTIEAGTETIMSLPQQSF